MKLLYLTNGICGSGGLERVLCIKTRHFIDEQHHDVAIICLNEQGRTPFFDFHPDIQFYDIELGAANKLSRYLIYMKSVARLVQDYQPDIIFVCDDGVKGLFVPLWLKTKAKLVYERHAALGLNNTHVVVQKFMRKAVCLYDAFVVLTPTCKKDWGNKSNIVVIPNPLEFIPQRKTSLNHKRAICVGTLNHNKGYDLLLQSLALIRDENWHIDVYGKGEKQKYINLAKSLDLNLEKVCFKGVTRNIVNAYLSADFLILPSRTEGFGMVLIEAMSYGLPCIAFDCPNGPKHLIDHNQNGFLVKNGDIHEMAYYIKTMLNTQSEQMQLMSSRAQNKIKSYTMDEIGILWENLYLKLAD